MSRKLLVVAAFAIAAAATADAQTPAVDQARASGVVGERFDGYLGFAAPTSQMVKSQVSTINIRRRALYSRLAASKGASAQDVGITAGCQLLDRLEIGQAYMLADGVWRRREAGRTVVPDYCR
ncbi:MAG: YdbL family protein [Pseudomonadota bacterium]